MVYLRNGMPNRKEGEKKDCPSLEMQFKKDAVQNDPRALVVHAM